MNAFKNKVSSFEVSLIINGKDKRNGVDNIGSQPAVLSTFLAIQNFNPDLIINAGTAGGFKERGMEIGDVVVAQGNACFHDRRIPIPAFEAYGLGEYPLLDMSQLIRDLGFKPGIISTGNAFDYSQEDKTIMEKLGATVKDMEAASVAWMAELSDTPLMILKSVTDYVDLHNNNEKEFIEYFRLATTNLTKACRSIIDYLSLNPIQNWENSVKK